VATLDIKVEEPSNRQEGNNVLQAVWPPDKAAREQNGQVDALEDREALRAEI